MMFVDVSWSKHYYIVTILVILHNCIFRDARASASVASASEARVRAKNREKITKIAKNHVKSHWFLSVLIPL